MAGPPFSFVSLEDLLGFALDHEKAFSTDSDLIATRDNSSHGVLKLTLAPPGYNWEFVALPGDTFAHRERPTATQQPAT